MFSKGLQKIYLLYKSFKCLVLKRTHNQLSPNEAGHIPIFPSEMQLRILKGSRFVTSITVYACIQ